VEEIDRSSAEQSRGVAQISLSMSEISNAASETSKQADELAAGSDEMTNATRQMKAEIDRYKLRSIETDSTSDILANLSPEMLAQLQQMVSAKPANGYANGASSKLLDQDARGYGSF
jgi:methyl-accepting chemotaxis protein